MEKIIFKFWRGEITLWKSYWLVGELLNAFLIFLIFNMEIYIFDNDKFNSALPFLDFSNFSLLSKLILIGWTIFTSIGIWRSAENYKGNIIWIIACFIFISYRVFTLRLIFFG